MRGRDDCFTEADPAGTAQGPCGGDFGAGRPNGPGARFHVGTLRREIPFIPKTTAGTWLGPVVGAAGPGGPPPARDVRQSDLVRGGGWARETRTPTMTFARAKNPIRSTIPEELVERINMPVRIGIHSPELDHMIFVLAIDLTRVYSLGIAACPMALDSKHGHCNKTRAPEQGGV